MKKCNRKSFLTEKIHNADTRYLQLGFEVFFFAGLGKENLAVQNFLHSITPLLRAHVTPLIATLLCSVLSIPPGVTRLHVTPLWCSWNWIKQLCTELYWTLSTDRTARFDLLIKFCSFKINQLRLRFTLEEHD